MMLKKLSSAVMVATVSSLMVVGCTTNAYTGESQMAKTGIGAGIGAIAGGVLGAIVSDDKKKGAMIGAGIGAIAGGGVGLYMDKQESQLRDRLQDSGVSVTREGDRIILNMPGNITFDTGKSNVKGDFTKTLDAVADVLEEFEKTIVNVEGHTDSVGSEKSNQTLSLKRAQSVSNYLLGKGVISARLYPVGYGELRPVADNATTAGKQANRRVEITLDPITE
jgi:outer membrane protein OmpA-like peptidoglycan-associated protein